MSAQGTGVPETESFNVLWLQAGSCGGCTMSALLTEDSSFFDLLKRHRISFLWHPSLAEETGPGVVDLVEKIRAGGIRLDALLVEGSVMQGPNGTGRFQMFSGTERSMSWWIGELAQRAAYTVAIGSCAAYGGIPAAPGNVTDASGIQYLDSDAGGLLGGAWRSPKGLPVINVAGCAPHPGWIVETLLALRHGDLDESDLDTLGRPAFYAHHLAHHGCSRNEYYEFKASAQEPSQLGCLMENLGCKATQAPGDCNLRRWNGSGSCTSAGYACVACTVPGFEAIPGFLETPKVAGIPVGLPVDMPKAWFVALAALSKSATPNRVKKNAEASRVMVPPARRRIGPA